MKGVVLCAGRGTRLRPLTDTIAKHLLPLANKPVLFYGLEQFAAAGVRDIALVASPHSRVSIAAAVGDGAALGIRATYVEQREPLGLAHAVACARAFVGDEPFVMHLGDTPIQAGFAGLAATFAARRPSAVIGVAAVDTPSRYGIAEVAEGRVTGLAEKPRQPRSNLALVGAYVLSPEIFPCIEALRPSARGEYEITDALQALVERGRLVCAHEVPGWWQDTGTLADMLAANRFLLARQGTAIAGAVDRASAIDGPVVVAPGARVVASTLRGPLMIGAGACIERSHLGPHVAIADHVTVSDSTVENAIVMEACRITGMSAGFKASLVGRNVHIRGAATRAAEGLVLGDDSVAEC